MSLLSIHHVAIICADYARSRRFYVELLGLRVLGYDPFVGAERMAVRGIKKVSLAEGLSEADFVSVHIKYDEKNSSNRP